MTYHPLPMGAQMATDPKPVQRPGDSYGKPLPSTRHGTLLAQAKLTQSFQPTVQRHAVSKLVFESVLSGAPTSGDTGGGLDDSQGYRYWEFWLFEPMQIYQFAELLALHTAGTGRVRVLDRYLLQIFERLRAVPEAGETGLSVIRRHLSLKIGHR